MVYQLYQLENVNGGRSTDPAGAVIGAATDLNHLLEMEGSTYWYGGAYRRIA